MFADDSPPESLGPLLEPTAKQTAQKMTQSIRIVARDSRGCPLSIRHCSTADRSNLELPCLVIPESVKHE